MILKKCTKCNSYTMRETCSKCSSSTISAHPMKFSIEKEKKYGKYRNI